MSSLMQFRTVGGTSSSVGRVMPRLILTNQQASYSLTRRGGATRYCGCLSGRNSSSARMNKRRFLATLSRESPNTSELRVYNSLTQTLEPLPLSVGGNKNEQQQQVQQMMAPGCYTCGPTVYAPAHLGHARTYVWLDIIRRVWEQQCAGAASTKNCGPLFVLNITDVDDKILAAAEQTGEAPLDLARRYEREFWNDWDALHCLRPHVVVRVTEHVDSDIVPYIERLVDTGMAYHVDGMGVYFDVGAYEDHVQAINSRYGKLAPPSQSTDLFQSQQNGENAGEHDVSASSSAAGGGAAGGGGKRDARDFALWKQRKDGERMYWSSPWGPGRPGWHIECSAMIETVQQRFRDTVQFAVHAGGVDLKFPHHANEIAQAEAYHVKTLTSGTEWIAHWVHTGHLNIDGMKMSKSLKNFITIQEMLLSDGGDYHTATPSSLASPADDFRLWCLGLSGSYRGPATYSQERLRQAKGVREKLVRFLVDAEVWLRDTEKVAASTKKWTPKDQELFICATDETARAVGALMNDFDGATCVEATVQIAEKGSRYLAQTPPGTGPFEAVRSTVDSLRSLLSLVGFSDSTCRAGLHAQTVVDDDDMTSTPAINVVGGETALLDELVRFRASIRELTVEGLRGSSQPTSKKEFEAIMEECDRIRDTILPAMGVELLDGKIATGHEGDSAWRACVPRFKSNLEQQQQQQHDGESIVKPVTAPSTPPPHPSKVSLEEFFRVGQYEGQFSAFDDTDFPILKADGSELSNRLRKKLRKKREKHAKFLKQVQRK